MLRTIRRSATVLAAAAAAVVAVSGQASAVDSSGIAQMDSAIQITALDSSQALLQSSSYNVSDFTCANPVVGASQVTSATNVVLGETYGSYAAEAVGHCMSYQGGSAQATLTVWLEYQPYTWAPFQRINACPAASSTAPAVAGVHAIVTPALTCTYRYVEAWAGRPMRAHAVLVHSGAPTREYHGYSTVSLETSTMTTT